MIVVLALIYWTLSGMVGMRIAEIKGYSQIPAFWISVVFGIFGLIYLSSGTAAERAQG